MSTFKPLKALTSRRQVLKAGLAALTLTGIAQQAQAKKRARLKPVTDTANPKPKPRSVWSCSTRVTAALIPAPLAKTGQKKTRRAGNCKNVRSILRSNGIDARLTRTGDTFIPLYDRVEIAHKHGADLFMSIHADGFTNPSAAGASVFALSNRGASSAMAKYLSDRENRADEVAGKKATDKDHLLQQVLFDLVQTDTIKNSLTLGSHILKRIKPVHRLHSKSTEQAAFVVLKSPSIPSVLVETSFITNPEEERLLGTAAFRQKIANAIASGIISYFNWFDNQKAHSGNVNETECKAGKTFLLQLQDEICQKLAAADGGNFQEDNWQREAAAAGVAVCCETAVSLNRRASIFPRLREAMPASATAHRPELAGRSFRAMGVSLVVHPHNPFVPTSHANVRFSLRKNRGRSGLVVWGRFRHDPYYGFEEDAVHWHTTARDLCLPFGEDVYPKYKSGATTTFTSNTATNSAALAGCSLTI